MRLGEATTVAEILEVLSKRAWHKAHNGAQCPPDRVPTEAALCDWLPTVDIPEVDEANKRLSELYGGDWQWMILTATNPRGRNVQLAARAEGAVRGIKYVHADWRTRPENKRPQHPLEPLVQAWQVATMPPVNPARHKPGILGASLVKRTERRQEHLPDLSPPRTPGLVHTHDIACLPGILDEPRRKIPALLTLFDMATGGKVMRGRADIAVAIFVEGLISVPADGQRAELRAVGPFTIGEIAGDWLQWDRQHYRPNKSETGLTLMRALHHVHNLAVPVGKNGWFYPLLVRGVEGLSWHHRVIFLAQLPPGSEVGPQVNRTILRILRKLSAPAYRGYLSLCFDWDYYGGHGGKLIRPTRPVAIRNEQGYILTQGGNVVTGKGGVPIKSPYDKRAILTGTYEPNPARERYPLYDADDLVRLCYPVTVYDNLVTRRQARGRTRHAIRLIEKKGGCVIESIRGDGKSLPWRIMPPDSRDS